MNRRAFIAALGGAAAWPGVGRAQQPTKVRRIGFLRFGPASANAGRLEALRAGLRDLGYVEGRTIVIEFGWAETVDQLHERAAELVRMNVDVIFAVSSTEANAARQATKTIPIVFAAHADPVGLGHVATLARVRREHHGTDGAANRPDCEGVRDIQGSPAAGHAVRCGFPHSKAATTRSRNLHRRTVRIGENLRSLGASRRSLRRQSVQSQWSAATMNLEQQHQWDAWARAHITNYLATVGVDWISSLLEHERKHMAEHVGAALGKFRAEHDMRLREIEAQLRETQRQLDQLCGNPTDKVEIVDLPPWPSRRKPDERCDHR